jgi:hypothetical protein
MRRRLFWSLNNSSYRRFEKATVIWLAILMSLTISPSSVRQVSSQELQSKQPAEIGGIDFAIPPGFELEQSQDKKFAFMRSAAQQIALFVAVPDRQVDDEYLTDLSNDLASRLLPKPNHFEWKILQRASDRRTSKYQTNAGTAKGISGKRYVQTDYVVVNAQRHAVVVGSIATFGEEREAKFLFDVEGSEYSVLGWQALFQLIPSVTGEKAP